MTPAQKYESYHTQRLNNSYGSDGSDLSLNLNLQTVHYIIEQTFSCTKLTENSSRHLVSHPLPSLGAVLIP
jgi:hypothetical protein